MRALYLQKEELGFFRKIMIDMAYLASHKQIRLPKYYFEDDLFFPYSPNKKDPANIEKYFLTKDKIIKEDEHHYFFIFPFKADQVESVAF
jgi:hypothetical protein